MYKTPYETTTLSNYNVSDIKNKIERELIDGEDSFRSLLTDYSYVNNNLLVLNIGEYNVDIPIFTQALLVNTNPVTNDPKDNKFIIDCRGFTKIDNTGMVTIKKLAQYRNHIIAGAICAYWYYGGHRAMLNYAKLPTKVFSHWMTGVLSSKLNLDELSQVRSSAIVAYYFICLFGDSPEYSEGYLPSEDEAYAIGLKVAYATGLKVYDAISIIDKIPTMSSINDLTTALKEHGGSDRYRQLNTAVLYTLLGRFGMNGMTPETVITALEYPPLMYAMTYIAATERGYSNSAIGKVVHNMRNATEVKNFAIEMRSTLDGE